MYRIIAGISTVLCCLLLIENVSAQTNLPALHNNWQIENSGSIFFDADKNLPYSDHIEMSGSNVSLWVQYGVDTSKHLSLSRTVVFPNFRILPNDTHGSLMYTFKDGDLPRFFIDGKPLRGDIISGRFYKPLDEKVSGITHNGIMKISSSLQSKTTSLQVERKLFPSVDQAAAIEAITFKNIGASAITVTMESKRQIIKTDSAASFPKSHHLVASSVGSGTVLLQQGQSVEFGVSYQATDDVSNVTTLDIQQETVKRERRMTDFTEHLQLQTPDTILNTAFEFAKRRIGESIFTTKVGPMMCPGGLSYYAAIWANDEAEYSNPFYPFTGDSLGNAASVNTYMMFAKYMNTGYKPIPSSIVAAGDGIWAGAGDRGDAAMIAYGASRFALAYGNVDTAKKLWPLIEWCLEFCRKNVNTDGVVASDNDELEGRFPAGKANLNTSSLYYDALVSAGFLSKALQLPASQKTEYEKQAKAVKIAIEKYFGADMKGFKTYKYYKENTLLRSWICTPLAMGILERKQGTVEALYSAGLFTADGFLTQEGSSTFWDRSTLYALRGIFAAGETGRALAYLHYYSQRRLLGNHVPYPVEAYPEGDQRHLAGESALYCRVFTEGVFGIRPTGLSSFECTPQLPAIWPSMSLKKIEAFGRQFDLNVTRKDKKIAIEIVGKNVKSKVFTVNEGSTVKIDFNMQ